MARIGYEGQLVVDMQVLCDLEQARGICMACDRCDWTVELQEWQGQVVQLMAEEAMAGCRRRSCGLRLSFF